MALDATKVIIGLADQSATTGAISSGPIIKGADVPATMDAALTATSGFASSGYCDSDGLGLTFDISTNDIKEWNGNTVRKLLESFDGTLSWTVIQMDYDGWCQAVGEENVTRVAATSEHGEQLHVRLGSHLAAPKAWAFRMKDGDARMLVLVPNGQVTNLDEVTFNSSDPIALPITLSCYDDGTGEAIHIYTDDGQKASA